MDRTPTLLTVKQFLKKHPWPENEFALRYIIASSETNGFKDAFVRVGRRVLINVEKFFDCTVNNKEYRKKSS